MQHAEMTMQLEVHGLLCLLITAYISAVVHPPLTMPEMLLVACHFRKLVQLQSNAARE